MLGDRDMNKEQNKPTNAEVQAAYEAVNQHWSHAEQERWSILYNFLMASTILLLAWATVYASAVSVKLPVLLVLSAGGVLISLLWPIIGCRVNLFIRRYGELGEKVENLLHLQDLGPFHRGETIRAEEQVNVTKQRCQITAMERVGRLIPSRVFVLIIPGLFAAIYLLLFILSWPVLHQGQQGC